ncbi:MAG: MMPL family transporter, partial [Candidatus Goldbacteria bacterium]|nr:MMPL family transporter [Candidatus Goldiibacteriota bacterium]
KLFKITKEQANEVIAVISESGAIDGKEMKELLKDKKRLVNEFFMDEKLAEKISRKIKRIDEIEIQRVYTLPVKEVRSLINIDYIKGEKDKFKVIKIFDGEKVNEKDVKDIEKKIKDWKLYSGFLVSEDGTLSGILVQLNNVGLGIKGQVYESILDITKNSPYKVYVGGGPVVTYSINKYILSDLLVLVPLVGLVVIVILFLSFGNLQGVFYPLFAVILAAAWAVGLMSYLNIPLNIISSVIPVMLIAVGSAYGIHFMNNYFHSNEKDKKIVLKDNIITIGVSIFLAGLTTIVGFSSLITGGFRPLKHFGLFTSIGILFAIFIALFLIPSFLLLGKKEKTIFFKEEKKNDLITKFLEFLSHITITKSKFIIFITVILIIIFAIGIFKIKVEMNDIEFFRQDTQIRMVDNLLNKKMSGTQNLDIVFETKDGSSVLKKDLLEEIEVFCNKVVVDFPKIGKVFYLNEYLKKMNQEMYGGLTINYKLPDTDEKINDYMLLYSGKIDSVITANKDKTRVTLIMKRLPTVEIVKLKKYIYKYFNEQFLSKYNLNITVTGYANLYVISNDVITWSMLKSLFVSLIIVFFINLYSFKSLKLSFISLMPVIVTLVITFGIMGYIGIPFNTVSSMIAGVAIGIGIDYPIHYLVRYLRDRKTKVKKEAAAAAITEIGRGIIYNVISVAAGFMVLFASKFIPLTQFGALMCFVMVLTGFGALTIIPALLMLFDNNTSH